MINQRNSKRPNFLIIGAAKSGTTSLFMYLKQHPNIFMTDPKEPCYFDENVNWEKGEEWYFSLFKEAREDQICGEASTNYTRWPQVKDVPKKIFEFVPNVKLIYLMREPASRAYAHYVHRWTKEVNPGKPITENFEKFVENDPMCIDGGLYAKQLDQYRQYFPSEQIYPIVFENLVQSPHTVMKGLFEFLDLTIPDEFQSVLPKANENKSFRKDKAKLALRDKLKENLLARIIIDVLPASFKHFIYEKIFLKSHFGSKITDKFEPVKLSEEEKEKLKNFYHNENIELQRKYGVDITPWYK